MAPRVISLTLAAACAVVAFLLAGQARDATRLQRAESQGARGNFIAAMRAAAEVKSQPSLTRARAVHAYASLGIGDLPNANRWFSVAVADSPDDWVLRRDWAVTLVGLGRFDKAKAQLRAAERLNPRLKKKRTRSD